jgi:hypothetical protein
MNVIGSFSGEGPGAYVRRYYIEASLTKGQVVAWSGSAVEGSVGDPVSVNDYVNAVGVLLSQDLTYSTTSGAGGVLGEVTADPLQRVLGRASGTVTAGGSLIASTGSTDSHIITVTAASATVATSGQVGTSEALGGYLIGLSGVNKGHVRIMTAHSDNTSTTVTNPFDASMASGDTFLRTYAPFQTGIELVTDFTQFAQTTTAGEDYPNTGEATIVNIWIDGSPVDGVVSPNKTRNLYARVLSESAPEIGFEVKFVEHVYGNVIA